MERKSADYWIHNLKLKEHPEGGFYHECFASKELINHEALPKRYNGDRKHYTSIYFLLGEGQVSHFHRIKSDEIWAFHAGGALNIHVISPEGHYSILKLGTCFEKGEVPQQMVPAGSWFGASLSEKSSYGLVGCFVAPGFDFADFELAKKNELLKLCPGKHDVIEKLTLD